MTGKFFLQALATVFHGSQYFQLIRVLAYILSIFSSFSNSRAVLLTWKHSSFLSMRIAHIDLPTPIFS